MAKAASPTALRAAMLPAAELGSRPGVSHTHDGIPLPPLRVLVVDDDGPVRNACAEIAAGLGFSTQAADSVSSARMALAHSSIDILLLDLKLPGGGGLALLEDIRAEHPQTIVVIMTAFATVSSVVESMRSGAGDYLTKPFTLEELSNTLQRAARRRTIDVESRLLRDRLRSGAAMGNLVGNSPAMEKIYRILSKVANTTHPVLIVGEPGTGKELVARSIHTNGPNAEQPFVPVDCESLLPSMIEGELFGYVKGAIPGANRSKVGLLAGVEGSTIFLDEVGSLPLDLQGRLLRALQEKEVRPIGVDASATGAGAAAGLGNGLSGAPSGVAPLVARILAASSRDLLEMVETGRFRKDLYFRLNVVNIRLPALRERRGDIPLLAAHILERMKAEHRVGYHFADEALRLLMEYDWPGNVRELEQAIERACSLSSGPVLHIADFPTQMGNFHFHSQQQIAESSNRGLVNGIVSAELPIVQPIAELEKQAILNTISQLNGDKLMAARLLGIGKTTLYRKLKEYGLGDEPA
ncbi:MAG: sigma-54-dependent transcriptional regulator [Acidobacteriaceae bacterium]